MNDQCVRNESVAEYDHQLLRSLLNMGHLFYAAIDSFVCLVVRRGTNSFVQHNYGSDLICFSIQSGVVDFVDVGLTLIFNLLVMGMSDLSLGTFDYPNAAKF